MSSILDALRKFEQAEAAAAPESVTWHAPPRKGRWTAAGVTAAFVAGVGLALWLREGAPPPTASTTAPAKTEPVPARAKEAPPPVPKRKAAARPTPAPPAIHPTRVASTPAAPPELAPAAPAAPLPPTVVAAEPPRGRVGAAAEPVAPAPVEVAARTPERLPEPRRPEPADGVLTRPPPGAPRIQVSFLVYSAVPERRTVALSVDGGSLVTLREGEGTHDVEVERISADRVQVRHGGQRFTVRAHD